MKNYCTFVAFLTGTILMVLVSVVIFIATNTAVCAAEYRLSISNGCRALKPVIVPVRTEKDSLSSFKYFNFSFMTGTMKNQSMVKHSSHIFDAPLRKCEINYPNFQNLMLEPSKNPTTLPRIGHKTGDNSPVEGNIEIGNYQNISDIFNSIVIGANATNCNIHLTINCPQEIINFVLQLIKKGAAL